MQSTLNYYSL